MIDIHSFLVYMGNWKHWHERVPICAWWIWDGWSKPLALVLWCGGTCLMCVCISSKGNIFCSLSASLGMHMFDHGIKWLLPFTLNLSPFRDAVTGPILSLTTNHVCPSHSGFWVFISNDLDLGTAFDGACCFYQLSIYVGSQFICKSWFLQGLITGCPTLPSLLLMGAVSTSSSTIVCCKEPDQKGPAC